MGLKSGSRDAGLDDSEDDEEREQLEDPTASEPVDEPDESEVLNDDGTADSTIGDDTTTSSPSSGQTSADDRPTMSSIPYKLRRDRVNEGREQVPYFLREEIIDAEDGLKSTLEDILGEDVYKSDYREAAMVVAQRNPELVAEVLREWGYDLDM